jgi:hypothetical protein
MRYSIKNKGKLYNFLYNLNLQIIIKLFKRKKQQKKREYGIKKKAFIENKNNTVS